jgi:cytochrome c biogenesis protein CcmG, thiol:disulfide interchange protein DsbE
MERRLLPPLLLFLLLAVPAFAGPVAPGGPRPAPRFSLPGVAGPVALDSLRGRVVYVDFWASWCGPCRASFPWMATMQQRYSDRGFTVVAVNLDKDRKAADAFLARYPAGFPVAFDPAGTVAEAYGVPGMPTSYLIGRDGTIRCTHVGFVPRKAGELEALIQEACAR